MSRFGGNLEYRCERPGLWVIEGYRVERTVADSKTWWQVFHGERFVGKTRLLEDAATVIDDDQHERRRQGE